MGWQEGTGIELDASTKGIHRLRPQSSLAVLAPLARYSVGELNVNTDGREAGRETSWTPHR